jgi:predicted metal-binding protein
MEPETVTLSGYLDMETFISDFVDVERFLGCCSECPSFGKTWACPPYGFDPMDIWSSHIGILLYAKKLIVPEDLRSRIYGKEELSRVMMELVDPVKTALMNELYDMERAEPGSLALSAGGCDLCEECARGKGLPCFKPELMRCSVESLGGNVIKCITELLGEEVLWADNGKLPEHFILLGGLLK